MVLPLPLPYWSTNQQFNSYAVIMKFNDNWHGVPSNYEMCQLLSITHLQVVPKMLSDENFPYFLFINISKITSGWIKKKSMKICAYNPAELWTILQEIRGSIAKKQGGRKEVQYSKVQLTTRCNRGFYLQILLLAQHVSGITMPIIRSSRVLYRGCCLWYFLL